MCVSLFYSHIDGILPKEPCRACLRMADRAHENISNIKFPLNFANIIGFNGADINMTENQYVHNVCYRELPIDITIVILIVTFLSMSLGFANASDSFLLTIAMTMTAMTMTMTITVTMMILLQFDKYISQSKLSRYEHVNNI